MTSRASDGHLRSELWIVIDLRGSQLVDARPLWMRSAPPPMKRYAARRGASLRFLRKHIRSLAARNITACPGSKH